MTLDSADFYDRARLFLSEEAKKHLENVNKPGAQQQSTFKHARYSSTQSKRAYKDWMN